MNTVTEVLKELKNKGTEQTRKTLVRHGAPDNLFGVKVADLKNVAKRIKGKQSLACELYESGNYDAMYLAGLVADGSQMSKKDLESWAKGATGAMIAEYPVAWVACESPHGRSLAMKWIRSRRESIASSGWCTYGGLLATTPDEELDLDEIRSLLQRIKTQIEIAPNRVRYCMNGFVIAVGAYVAPLLDEAKETAEAIGAVEVNVGDTACKVPLATAYIEKIEKSGRIGKKRKTVRC